MGKRSKDQDPGEPVAVVIEGNTGPVHLGTGDIITNSVVISGPGAVYVAGDNPEGISRTFD